MRLNRLSDTINEMKVNWMFLTPTVAALISPDEVPTVKTLVLGGEHATSNNFSTWGGRQDVCLINSYGHQTGQINNPCQLLYYERSVEAEAKKASFVSLSGVTTFLFHKQAAE